jgi:hypothetical protein
MRCSPDRDFGVAAVKLMARPRITAEAVIGMTLPEGWLAPGDDAPHVNPNGTSCLS